MADQDTVIQIPDDIRRRALFLTQLTQAIQQLYSIAILDLSKGEVLSDTTLDPAGNSANAEYFFSVPPKVHEQSEPFATTVVATQGGGKFVETQGSFMKEVRISGTTGVRPNKINFGTPNKVSPKESTGFDDIVFLKNMFRKYSDLKLVDVLAYNIVMVWRNIKDQEFWIVEPMDFKVSQSSQSPLSYEYSIQFKLMSRLDRFLPVLDDTITSGFLGNPSVKKSGVSLNKFLSQLNNGSRVITQHFFSLNNEIRKVPAFANKIQFAVAEPVLGILRGTNAIATTSVNAVPSVLANAATLFDRTADLLISLNAFKNAGKYFNDGNDRAFKRINHTLRRMQLECAKIIVNPVCADFNSATKYSKFNRLAAAYIGVVSTTGALSNPSGRSFIGNQVSTAAVQAGIVHFGETIADIAGRLIGDRSQWKQIVVLNNLRAPYVGPIRGEGILAYGDSIMIPAQPSRGLPSATTTNSSTQDISNNDLAFQTPVERAYGRDIRIARTNEQFGLSDIVVGQFGDISTIQGIPNVVQGTYIKFVTEPGQLPAHPLYGAKMTLGSKATESAVSQVRINAYRTVLTDPRIGSIKSLNYVAVGDTVRADIVLQLRNAADLVSTSVNLI